MKRRYLLAPLVLVAAVIGYSLPAGGQGTTTRPRTTLSTPDGGLPVTLGSQRVAVEATGPAGAALPVTGTVGLSASAIASLGPAPCTLRADDWVPLSASSASPVPPNLPDGGTGALTGRTEILIVNASATTSVVCGPASADGGLPEWGVRGTPLFSGGGSAEFEARDNVRIYCRANTGTNIPVAPVEASCAR